MADDVCLVAFEGYVGESYDDSPYDYEAVLPSDAAWEAGDRSLWCLVDADGATGSVRRGG